MRPTLSIGMDRLELPWYIVSVTRDRDQRLEKVLSQTKQAREWKSDWFGATLKLNSSTLRSLSRNSYLETDFPAHQILVWLEKGIEQEGSASTIEAAYGNGQYWLDFSKEARSGVVRIQFPNSMNSALRLQIKCYQSLSLITVQVAVRTCSSMPMERAFSKTCTRQWLSSRYPSPALDGSLATY